jgi:hypothetical protein
MPSALGFDPLGDFEFVLGCSFDRHLALSSAQFVATLDFQGRLKS